MKTNTKLLLKNKWYFFLLGIIFATCLTCAGIYINCQPKKEEKLIYYICAFNLKASQLKEESYKVTSNIREIRIHYETPLDYDRSTLFGYVNEVCDLYFVPLCQIERAVNRSITFSKEEINQAIPNSIDKELYPINGSYGGIKVYDKITKQGILKDILEYTSDSFIDDYYICFPKNSIHLGVLNNNKSDNIIKVTNYLLSI